MTNEDAEYKALFNPSEVVPHYPEWVLKLGGAAYMISFWLLALWTIVCLMPITYVVVQGYRAYKYLKGGEVDA